MEGRTKGKSRISWIRYFSLDCWTVIRVTKGVLTPTFRRINGGTVTAQIDYLFVTEMPFEAACTIPAHVNVCLKAS